MAESSDGQDKSEEPTGKRLQDAREKGQVPRSKELSTMAMMLTAALAFMVLGGHMLEMLLDVMRTGFQPTREELFSDGMMLRALADAAVAAVQGLSAFFVAMVAAAVIANIALSGWIWSVQAMGLKLEKLNPLKGLKKIFGVQGLMELGKSVAKFLIIMPVALFWLWTKRDELLGLGLETVEDGLAHTADLLLWTFLILALSLILLVLVDVPFQLWNHKNQLKMTKQEVKEERKNTDGNPEVKGRQRRIQMEAAMQRMMAAIPEADVVVTNPTHFAVALKYDQGKMGAPRLVAKGADLIAARIREEAEKHGVPLLRAPPLARAIYFNTEIDQEIPVGLYTAVAQVLAYVYQLKNGDVRAAPADFATKLPIPDEFLHDRKGRAPGPGEEVSD